MPFRRPNPSPFPSGEAEKSDGEDFCSPLRVGEGLGERLETESLNAG